MWLKNSELRPYYECWHDHSVIMVTLFLPRLAEERELKRTKGSCSNSTISMFDRNRTSLELRCLQQTLISIIMGRKKRASRYLIWLVLSVTDFSRSVTGNGFRPRLGRGQCRFESCHSDHFKQVPLKSCAPILSRACEPFPIVWSVQLEKSPRTGHPAGDGFHQCPINLKPT